MKKLCNVITGVVLLFGCVLQCRAQQELTMPETGKWHEKYCASVNEKLSHFSAGVEKAKTRYVRKMNKRWRQLMRRTGLSADSLFPAQFHDADGIPDWQQHPTAVAITGNDYSPYLDTLNASLRFIQELTGPDSKERRLLNNTQQLLELTGKQTRKLEKIKFQMQAQQRALLQLKAKYKTAAEKYILSVRNEYHYLFSRFSEYREWLANPSKAETALLAILRESSAFKAIMNRYSAIAGLFPVQPATASDLSGLQTRNMLQAALKEKGISTATGVQGMFSQQMQTLKDEMNQLRRQLPSAGTAADLPDAAPNKLKTKTFLQRVELGSNFRVLRAAQLFPAKSELMLTAGYKISDRGSLGVGFTHWLGWGESIRKISFSHQGLGFSSWLKFGLKNNLFINGGWEHNYFSQVKNMTSPGTTPAWKSSALLGISKRVGAGKSFLGGKWGANRKRISEITLLYDFLYKQNNPVTEAFKLRFGFTF